MAASGVRGSDAAVSGAGVMRVGCGTGGAGAGDRADSAGGDELTGTAGVMGAGDSDLAETAGITGAAGDRRASSAARDSKRAGVGG